MSEEQIEELSERELEIIELVAEGMSNREIARELYISPNTVKVHLRNIYGKMQVSSRTEATMVALRMGWVQIEPEGAVGNQGDGTGHDGDEGVQAATTAQADESVQPKVLPPLPRWKEAYLLLAVVLVGLGLWLTWPRTAERAQPFSDRSSSAAAWAPGQASRWQSLAQIPSPRSRLAVTAYDGRIYAIGGETAEGVSDAVAVYLTQSDEWVRGPNKPTAGANISAVAADGMVYVPGGSGADGEMSDWLEVLDVASGTWSERHPLPSSVCAYALAGVDGEIYLFGGWDGSTYLAQALRYDPETDTWEALPDMPTARAFAGAASIDGRIYVVGGYDGVSELDTCEVYDPEGTTWVGCPPMNAPRGGVGATTIGDALYVIGGGWDSYLVENEYFTPDETDPTQGTWETFPSPRLQEWRNLGVASSEMMLYAIGGWDGAYLSANQAYRAVYRLYLPSAMGQRGE
jgi:DNA-binding CsgD family transcriptional regulator/N-acetylneuraminic acid mutarotase